MSEYFTVMFEVEKSEDIFERFYKAMIASGVVYKSGFMSFKPESFEDIIRVNQNGLNNNQTDDERCRQIALAYCDFSEVRLYHEIASEHTLTFDLVVPEEDLCGYGDGNSRCCKIENMEALKQLAINIWESLDVLAIQTAWECSDTSPVVKHIRKSADVQAEPFAIIKKSLLNDNTEQFQTVGKDGLLIERKDNWFYV